MARFGPARAEGLVFGAFLVFLGSLGLFELVSPDLGLHVTAGGYTFHNGIPETNVFSPVHADYPLVQHEWAFQVATWAIVALSGMTGLSWVRLAVVLGIGAVLHATLRPGRGYLAGVACLALGLFVAHARFVWRPELISMLLLAAELKLLIDFVEGRRDRLLLLPPLFVVWVNVHGYFLAGLIALGAFAAGQLGELAVRGGQPVRFWRLIRIGALCALATLLNPYHVEGAIYPFRVLLDLLASDNLLNTSIGELGPPWAFKHTWGVKAWYPLLVVFAVATAAQGRRLRFSYLLTGVAFWLMARSTYRNIGLYGMTLGVLAAVQCQSAATWVSLPQRFARLSRWVAVGLIAALLWAAGFIGTDRLYTAEADPRRFGAGASRFLDPPARAFIAEHIPAKSQVFNSFDHGSRYLGWFYPERLPFLDGNGVGYPPEFFAEYRRIILCQEPFGPFARRYGIGWAYLGLDKPLATCLYADPAWQPVFLDEYGIVFVGEGPEFAEVRRRFDLRAELARGRPQSWDSTPAATLLRDTLPVRELLIANFLFGVGESKAAREVLATLPEGTELGYRIRRRAHPVAR